MIRLALYFTLFISISSEVSTLQEPRFVHTLPFSTPYSSAHFFGISFSQPSVIRPVMCLECFRRSLSTNVISSLLLGIVERASYITHLSCTRYFCLTMVGGNKVQNFTDYRLWNIMDRNGQSIWLGLYPISHIMERMELRVKHGLIH